MIDLCIGDMYDLSSVALSLDGSQYSTGTVGYVIRVSDLSTVFAITCDVVCYDVISQLVMDIQLLFGSSLTTSLTKWIEFEKSCLTQGVKLHGVATLPLQTISCTLSAEKYIGNCLNGVKLSNNNKRIWAMPVQEGL